MSSPHRITLYTVPSRNALQPEIALVQADVSYTACEIDTQNQPEWYVSKVNPARKLPAIAYGGPNVPGNKPSPKSVKITESMVIVEFIADLFPESGLLPKDPAARARVRFFVEIVTSKFVAGLGGVITAGNFDALWTAVEAIQGLLPLNGKFVVGDELTTADIAIAPFIARLEVLLRIEKGPFPEGQGTKALPSVLELLLEHQGASQLQGYVE